ncbi:MAG: ASKHA domain-containing protein [Armatimonadota bacterium]
MHKMCVKFLPDEKTVQVGDDTTILQAAEAAGVYVNRLCGGDGVCGRCKVIVRSGDVWAEPTMHLSREEVQNGYVLACKCLVRGDVVIEVPVESRLEGKPRLTDDDAQRFSSTRVMIGEGKPYPHDPLSIRRFFDLPRPTLEDNIADVERLYREIKREKPVPVIQMGLSPLRELAGLLREHHWQVTATLGQRGGTVEIIEVTGGDTSKQNYGVAVDIGTTTVVAHLVDLNNPRTVARQATYNSQIQYGEDVIARMMYAGKKEQLARLASCVVQDINDLIENLVASTEVSLNDITFVLCAGNTTMTHLLLGLDPSNIRLEPYIPLVAYPPVIRAAEAGIRVNPRGLLGCVPSVACYVGGDVVSGVLVSGMAKSPEPSLLIDVGTNAEIVVGCQDWSVCASASAGPTFEGGGISCGMRATKGAIERLSMRKGGQVISYSVIGGGNPTGLCGSGLMDTVAELLRNGCLTRSGALISDGHSGRVREGDDGLEFVLVEAGQTASGKDIAITEADLTNFIRSKGAIYHACDCLLDQVGLQFTDLHTVYISGGFGNYLDIGKGISIGLLPDLPLDCFQFIGNGSVQGAKMMLLSHQALAEAELIASRMTYIELSTDTKFMNEYTSALFLPHTDIEKFPSVRLEMAKSQHGG